MANIALSVNDSRIFLFNPKHIEESKRIDSTKTEIRFPDGTRVDIPIPQDIFFTLLRGRRELPGWRKFDGFRVRCKWEGGPIWHIAIHPFGDEKLVLEARFRSQDFAIFLPPKSGVFMPKRLER